MTKKVSLIEYQKDFFLGMDHLFQLSPEEIIEEGANHRHIAVDCKVDVKPMARKVNYSVNLVLNKDIDWSGLNFIKLDVPQFTQALRAQFAYSFTPAVLEKLIQSIESYFEESIEDMPIDFIEGVFRIHSKEGYWVVITSPKYLEF